MKTVNYISDVHSITKETNVIVGCGLSGIVMANKIATELDEPVVIIDKKDHIGGTCYDYIDKETGIHVHKYGPHIFRTNSVEVWNFLSKYTTWNPYMHRVLGIIDGIEVPIPFNLDSLHLALPATLANKLEEKLIAKFGFNTKVPILELRKTNDKDLNFLADYIYNKVFLNYTLKQWGLSPEQLDPAVTGQVPVFIGCDSRYFQERFQGIPRDGYTVMFERMLSHPNISVMLNTDFEKLKKFIEYKRLFYTGAIEEYFDYKFGKLPYRSLDIKIETFNVSHFQNAAVVNYPENYDFTRITENKYFLDEHSDKTILTFEYPMNFENGKNERIYPILNPTNQAIYDRYFEEAKRLSNVYFFGRLGAYRYYDMNRTIQGAFETFQKISKKD